MLEDLFLRCPNLEQSLDHVSAQVFSLLNLKVTEERESSNYVDGHYFLGHASNVQVQVCRSDDDEFSDYPFWVTLCNPDLRKNIASSINSSPEAIASTLALGGFSVFIPENGWEKVGWIRKGKVYGP